MTLKLKRATNACPDIRVDVALFISILTATGDDCRRMICEIFSGMVNGSGGD